MKKKTVLKVTGGLVAILAVCGLGVAIKPAITGNAEKSTAATPLMEATVEIEADNQVEATGMESQLEATEATQPKEDLDTSSVKIELSGNAEDTFTTTKEIITSQPTESVFEDFASWNSANWSTIGNQGYADLEAMSNN